MSAKQKKHLEDERRMSQRKAGEFQTRFMQAAWGAGCSTEPCPMLVHDYVTLRVPLIVILSWTILAVILAWNNLETFCLVLLSFLALLELRKPLYPEGFGLGGCRVLAQQAQGCFGQGCLRGFVGFKV